MRTTPRIIELVGPAGAGKTTLARALEQRSEKVARRFIPYWREPRQLPFFARNTLALLPTFTQLLNWQNGKRRQQEGIAWREQIAWMVILQGWHRVLRRPVAENREVLVLDEGPVFMLAASLVFDADVMNSPRADGWRCRMYRQWANTLDMVICLDAPNATLVQRIRSRDVWHGVKVKSEPMAFKFLDDYRRAYERVLSSLIAQRRDFQVLHFDTAQESLDELGDQVSTVVGLNHRERPNGDR